MNRYSYKKIDAFTSGKSLGNPAACIYLKDGQTLTEDQMLCIAKQHKGFVSEVIYCSGISPLDYKLIYFSSECEVDFCGHGTIACMYSLIKEIPELHCQNEIRVHTNKKGVLTIYNEIARQDAIYITAPDPEYIGTDLSAKDISKYLQIDCGQISDSYPIDMVDAGLRTLIVPITALDDEIHVFPDELKLKGFCLNNRVDIVLIYSLEAENDSNVAHTRVFSPKYGYLEDPATGSGNSAFGYYLLKNNIWDGSPVSIEQGGADRAFNTVKLIGRDGHVLFGGSAVTRIEGVYLL